MTSRKRGLMVPIVKAIYDAIGTDSPKVFVLAVTLTFAIFGFALAVVVNRGYQNSLRREHAAVLAKAQAEEFPAYRPQLLIVKWGQIEPDKAARPSHVVQQGFYIKNIGLGEAAIGVRVTLTVPTEVPDVWTNGEGSAPSVVIGRDQEAFVPLWRRLGGTLIGHVLSRFDLEHFLVQTYWNTFGNKEIPVTIRYTSNGKKYVTMQNLIYSPEQRYIVGFGNPVQTLDTEPSQ
jgi:hypothetical protein